MGHLLGNRYGVNAAVEPMARVAGRGLLGSASLGAMGFALLTLGAAPAAAQQVSTTDRAAQVDAKKKASEANVPADGQSSVPTTNVPSSPDPQATQTPGGSTEVPTQDAGTPAAGAELPDGQDSGDIVVTGFRASVTNAINTKRRADQILESVSAEDIGKLPDNSIAESIARLPGVTAQRVDGRDQAISVRGFAPDFSTTLFNGREQVTTGDNRAVEFDQYPSELLSQVVVYKTPSAGLIGQGLSGTIDLRSTRPLQYGKRVLAVNARGEIVSKGKLNADSDDKGYRFSGTYIDQFAGNTLGIVLGVAHIKSPTQFERYNAWGYPTFDGNNATYGTQQADGSYVARPEYASAQGKYILGGAKPFVQSNTLTRTGVAGTVEWQPSNDLTTTLDLLYTKFKEEQSLRGIEFPLFWGNAILQPGYTVTGNTISAGTWDRVKGVARSDYVERNAKIFSAGLNTKYTNDGWTLVGDASFSRVRRSDIYIENYYGTSRGVEPGGLSSNPNVGPYDTLGFQAKGDGLTKFNPALDYADRGLVKLTSPQGWAAGPREGSVPGGQDGYYSSPKVKDELYALRASISRDLDNGNVLELGGNYTHRKKSYVPTEFYLGLTANIADPTHTTSLTVPDKYYVGTTDFSYLGVPGLASFNTQALLRDGLLTQLVNANASTQLNTWTLHENVATGWLRYNFDTPMGDTGSFTGNVGVQIVYTDQSSDGFRNLDGQNNGTIVTDGAKYWEPLPSVNLSMRFDDSNVLRIGVARTLARARMDQLRASFRYGTNFARYSSADPYNAYFSGGGGNSKLRPWIADGVDLSLEHYVSKSGYFAVAGYYKYLESYIYESLNLFDFTGTPLGTNQGGPPGTYLGVVRQPVNGSGGIFYGTEVSGTLPLGDITSVLDGFGIIGSYSYTYSNITGNPDSPDLPLPGLSKHVANGTVFFEKAGFSARGSIRYRSSFLAEVISLGPGARNRLADSETVIDAQIGYEIQGGPLKGLGILVQGQNLTSEPFVTRDSASGFVIDSQDYGRRFLAGFAYKF